MEIPKHNRTPYAGKGGAKAFLMDDNLTWT